MNLPLIETKKLKKYFKTAKGNLHAVDDISIKIESGKTLGIVGESGCGKTTLGRTVIRLLEPTAGEIFFQGENIANFNKKQMYEMRKKMQIIFQDPYASLNPRMTVLELIAEPMIVCKVADNKSDLYSKAVRLMEVVGLSKRYVNYYPHELDGGRRQRIGIARALSLNPYFIVCDEPVSALDVSIQAQILNLMMDLQEKNGFTYMFITHNLSVIKHISDDIAVMYLGQCVEKADTKSLFQERLHPYTQALLKAIPIPSLKSEHKLKGVIKGEVTNPIEPKPGCRFFPRCPYATSKCIGENINLKEVSPGHFVACTLY